MATVSTQYYSQETITISLNNLGDASWRQSLYVDNSTNRYIDALLGGLVTVSATSPLTDGGTIEVYAYGSWTGGSTYTAGCTGADGAYSPTGEEGLLRLVETIVIDATLSEQYAFGPVSMASVFGGTLPSRWGVVVRNETNQQFAASGNSIVFQGVKFDSA